MPISKKEVTFGLVAVTIAAASVLGSYLYNHDAGFQWWVNQITNKSDNITSIYGEKDIHRRAASPKKSDQPSSVDVTPSSPPSEGYKFAMNPDDFRKHLNTISWNNAADSVEFLRLTNCQGVYAETEMEESFLGAKGQYYCKDGYVREVTPMGTRTCRIAHVVARKYQDYYRYNIMQDQQGIDVCS